MLGAANGRVSERGEWDIDESDSAELEDGFTKLVDDYADWLDGKRPAPPGAVSMPRNLNKIKNALEHPDSAGSIGCGVGRNMQAITKDGKIYPCHRYAGEDNFLLGTVENGLSREKVEEYYRSVLSLKDDHCSKCWARITCGGQCPWYISSSDGTVGHPDEQSCNGIRSGHEKQLWLLHRINKKTNNQIGAQELKSEEIK